VLGRLSCLCFKDDVGTQRSLQSCITTTPAEPLRLDLRRHQPKNASRKLRQFDCSNYRGSERRTQQQTPERLRPAGQIRFLDGSLDHGKLVACGRDASSAKTQKYRDIINTEYRK